MGTIGFIGVGNMGGALVRALAPHQKGNSVLLSSKTMVKAEALAAELDLHTASNEEICKKAEILIFGVKPYQLRDLLRELSPILKQRERDCVLVSMAAGWSCQQLEEAVGGHPRVLCIMPNTPSLLGKGVIPYSRGSYATEEDGAQLEELLSPAGLVFPLADGLMNAAGALSGCGPGFAYVFLEALADGAVACGLPRELALRSAAQTLIGAGEMVLRTGQHPGALKDAVCSPGGSTIAGICALEEHGLRSAAQKAVLAAFARNGQLGK